MRFPGFVLMLMDLGKDMIDIFYGLLPRTDGGLVVDPNTDIPVTKKFSNSHPDESGCLNQHLEKPKSFKIHFFP